MRGRQFTDAMKKAQVFPRTAEEITALRQRLIEEWLAQNHVHDFRNWLVRRLGQVEEDLLKTREELDHAVRCMDRSCKYCRDLMAAASVDVDEAWKQEVARRSDELQSGVVKEIPWEEVKEKARTLIRTGGKL